MSFDESQLIIEPILIWPNRFLIFERGIGSTRKIKNLKIFENFSTRDQKFLISSCHDF